MKTVKALVTGATGHVGYALVQELQAQGYNLRLLLRKETDLFRDIRCEYAYGDVTQIESLPRAFHDVDIVFHLAGMIEVNRGNDALVWDINLRGTQNVLAACRDCGVKRLVYASSVDAYPPLPDNREMTEIAQFSPKSVTGTYAKTKAEATQLLLDCDSPGLDIVIVYPGACIGPYDFRVSSVGEMVRMFIHGKFPVSLNFGAYSFVDVRDVAKGMCAAAEKGQNKSGYILSGERVTVDTLIQLLAEVCQETEALQHIKAPRFKLPASVAMAAAPFAEIYYRATNTTPLFTRYAIRKLKSNCNFSSDKARRELGYQTMPLKQSISDMVNWILDQEAQ